MKVPEISIIVAVYKAEKYLHVCIDSLLLQTFTNFEILLIDDGSPDRSGEICDEYAKKDSRIRVFHKENGGVSSARQYGIDNMRGKFSIHADPDDWVEPEMLEKLYRKAVEEHADMVICDWYADRKGISIYINQNPISLKPRDCVKEMFQRLHGSLWNKLIKSTCYKGISFPVGVNWSEDLLVVCRILLVHKPQVAYLQEAFYHYQIDINKNSLCKQYTREALAADWKLYELLKKSIDEDLLLLEQLDQFLPRIILRRAFLSGVFSSSEFRKLYGSLDKYLRRGDSNLWKFTWLLYLSCWGYYRPAYILWKFLYRIYNFIYK